MAINKSCRRTGVLVFVVVLSLALVASFPISGVAAAASSVSSSACSQRIQSGFPSIRSLWSLVPSRSRRTGDFIVTWKNSLLCGATLKIVHESDPDRVLWENNRGQAFVTAAIGEAQIKESSGSFKVTDRITKRCKHQTVDCVKRRGGAVIVSGRFLETGSKVRYEMSLTANGENGLDFDIEIENNGAPEGDYNRVYFTYASSAEERFFGFGEQFTYFDMKGRKVPILSQEQGIGRGLQPWTFILNLLAGSGGSWHSTYTAVPHYISSECRSLFLRNTEYSEFDMRCPSAVQIKLFSASMNGRLLNGHTPLELIEEFTAYSGRMAPLPEWLNSGAVVGMQGGTERVQEVLEELDAHDVPIAAFWLQDWVGKRQTVISSQLWWNWEVDTETYPGWEELVQDLRDRGIRVMIYINPSLVDASEKPSYDRNLFAEAKDLGYLVKDETGEPYMIPNTTFSAALIDLTNPDARQWYKDVIREELLDTGVSGWMADYAENLPFDCVLAGGENPASYHNIYPVEWARLNREVVQEAGLEGDVVFFSRSGAVESPGLSTLFWTGDQLVTWDEHDGIKTAVTGMLSGGLSGYSLNHSDIGGFTTIGTPLLPGFGVFRTRELLFRWMELSAFTTVYRTHEGSLPEPNAQFYDDDETYDYFARFAKVYKALAFYREQLMGEASATGYPMMRHPFLHYPDDPETYGLRHQFMLGSELMVAPVLDQGRDTVDLYLPAGEWVHVWSGDVYGMPSEGSWVNAPAPMGEPAVFYRNGSPQGLQFVENLVDMGLL